MAITLVGSAVIQETLPAATYTFTYSSTAGNWLVISSTNTSNGGDPATPLLVSITDSASNTWHVSTGNAVNPPTQGYDDSVLATAVGAFVAYAPAAAAVTTVTITWRAAYTGGFIVAGLSEWSGVSSVDDANTSTGTYNGGGHWSCGPVTLSSAQDVIVAAAVGSVNVSALPAGWNRLAPSGFDRFSGYVAAGTAAGPGAYTVSFTTSSPSGTVQYGTAALALKPASSAPPSPIFASIAGDPMLSMSQVTIGTTVTTLGILGPGGSVTIQPPASGSSTVAIGSGTGAVTMTNGYPLYAGGAPVFVSLPLTSQSATLTAISSGTTSVIGLAWAGRS